MAKTDSRQIGPFEVPLLTGGAILAVLEGGLWLWTGVAGTLFGSGWPHLTLATLWHATSGVARHLSDPRQGFAGPVRAGVPGPAAFYATLLLLATLAGLRSSRNTDCSFTAAFGPRSSACASTSTTASSSTPRDT